VFADAKEAMKAKEYEKALGLAQRTEDEFTSLIRERLLLTLNEAEEILTSVEGADLAASTEALGKARGHLEAGEIEQAADLATQLKAQLETLRRQGEEAEAALRRLRDVLADAEAMNTPLPRTSGPPRGCSRRPGSCFGRRSIGRPSRPPSRARPRRNASACSSRSRSRRSKAWRENCATWGRGPRSSWTSSRTAARRSRSGITS